MSRNLISDYNAFRVTGQIRNLCLSFIFLFTYLTLHAQDNQACGCTPIIFCEGFTITPKHRIEDHAVFWRPIEMDTGCANVEFFPTIRVAADGTQSTLLDVKNVHCGCGTLNPNQPVILLIYNENFEPIGNSQPDDYGAFEFDDFTAQTTTFKFHHPKRIPDPGGTYTYFVKIYQNDPELDNWGGFLVEVYRPPVVFIHGLWSEAAAFDKMESNYLMSGDYEDFQLYKSDYSASNASSFAYNDLVARNGITQVIHNCQDNNVSVGKVNLVVHSMGGLLSRQYIQGSFYPLRNDVNRLITCNTPHAGSQMANFLLDQSQYGNIVSAALGSLGMDCYGGAVNDLQVNNPQINNIQYGTQPGGQFYHSLITISTEVPDFSTLVTTAMANLHINFMPAAMFLQCGAHLISDVFDFDDNDIVVAAQSQSGGLNGLPTNTIQGQKHTGSVANNMVISAVRDLLNEPFNSVSYATSYPAYNLTYSLDFPCLPFLNEDETERNSGTFSLNIDSPATGSTFTAGDTVTISFSSSMLDSVVAIMRFHDDSIALIANAATAGSLAYVIPDNLLGLHSLVALGFASDKKMKVLDSIHLQIVTTATLDSLIFYPEVFFLNQLDSLSFSITGVYSDSMNRDLTDHPSVMFDFVFDNASKGNGSFIRLDSLESDTLRVNVGPVVSAPVLIQKTGYNFLAGCEWVTNTNDDGFGSLRYALECVNSFDTIRFAPSLEGDTISIDSVILDVFKSVYIINTHNNKIAIQSNSASRLFRIHSGISVWIENMNMIALNPDITTIVNNGNLTLKNVDLSNTYSGISSLKNHPSGQLIILGQCNLE